MERALPIVTSFGSPCPRGGEEEELRGSDKSKSQETAPLHSVFMCVLSSLTGGGPLQSRFKTLLACPCLC